MKKILSFLLIIIGLCGYSQDEYYRKVDWKFYPENVIQLTDSTYLTDAYPFDYNDVGAIQRVVGNYVVDFVGHRYEVIDSSTTTITVLDIYHIGQAPQTGQIARCYRSVGDGEAEYIGSIDYSPLDESSRWKLNGSDNELLWRQTIGKAENGLYKDFRTVKLGGNLIEPTTIDQDDNSLKILNNGHGSVFSETGIAYTKIDTALFGDSTLITKMYANSRISDAAYSSLWNSIATVAPSKNAIYDKIETLTPVSYCPLSMTVNTGTLVQGSVSDLCEVGGTDVIISESTGADPLRVTFAFNPVQRLTSFSFYGRYNGGATHVTYLEAYNYVAAEWQLIGELGNTPVKQWQSYNIFLPTNFISTGTVQVRFNHQGNGINTHQLILDYVDANYGGAGGSSFETASEIAFVPTGNIAGTNVQAAIQELDLEKEPLLTKGNLTTGSSKVTIGGTGTNALIGTGASIDVNEANIVHQNISGSGTNTHAQIDNHITNDGDLSSTNEIQDLSLSGNTLSLSSDASSVDLSVYAPASGSANYVQVSPASPQSGNISMVGSGTFGAIVTSPLFKIISDLPILSFKTNQGIGREWWWASSFNDPNSISLYDATANAQRIFVDDTGFVGIGVLANPTNSKLSVGGSINANTYKLSGVDLYSSLTTNTLQKWDGTKHTSIPNASGYLHNDENGNMSFTSIPAAVTSISAGDGMNFTTITGTGSITLGTPSSLTASTTNAVTTTSHTHQITGFLPLTGGTLTGAVTSNNSFTGTNFILSSDKRLKQGIRTLTNTDWVERIKFVRYEMKSNPEIERYGVIAQDVEEVNKYLVHTDEYGIKSVSYIDLLVAKIANLEKRISELENKKKRHEK